MLAWIEFGEQLGLWSSATFWLTVVSIVLTLGFTIVVFFGGFADLRFLLRALDEERVDAADDGRVIQPPAADEPKSARD